MWPLVVLDESPQCEQKVNAFGEFSDTPPASKWFGSPPKDHYGPHVYSPVQFGLDHAVERERYRAYSQRWGAPAEI